MSFLSPLGLLALASVPVLLWLWRLSASRRQTRIASLVPFEHLLKRTAARRKRLVINWLFWLQLAALLAATTALTQPQLKLAGSRTILAILDTSASMGARQGLTTAFDRAKAELIRRIQRKSPMDQVLLLASAPPTPLTAQPTSDGILLARLVEEQKVALMGGHLATTERLGRAILSRPADEIWVATDESRPSSAESASVRWFAVGQPAGNAAIVGVDTLGPLCDPSDARLMVTIQSFSEKTAQVRVAASQAGRQLAQQHLSLAGKERQFLTLALPEEAQGLIEVSLSASADALEADNHVAVSLEPKGAKTIAVSVASPSMAQTVLRWLSACPAVTASSVEKPPADNSILITDDPDFFQRASGPALLFKAPARAKPVAAYWMVLAEHPIASYLSLVDVVAAPINVSEQASPGIAVLAAILGGRKAVVVSADESEGRRQVFMNFDVSGQETATAITLIFFNSLRWLMGESNTRAMDSSVADKNLLDPLESNLLYRPSTWAASAMSGQNPVAQNKKKSRPEGVSHPLASWFIILIMLLLLLEWWLYTAKGNKVVS